MARNSSTRSVPQRYTITIERQHPSFARVPRQWLRRVVTAVLEGEGAAEAVVTLVLCTDRYIRRLNRQFLQHDWATDVITFPLAEQRCEGEIYISVDTARRQAAEYGVSLRNELGRLAAHGVLHLLGYDDATDHERARMHKLEDYYLARVAQQLRRR